VIESGALPPDFTLARARRGYRHCSRDFQLAGLRDLPALLTRAD